MVALFNYFIKDYIRSYRYFPPFTFHLVAVALCYSAPRPIPVLSSQAFTAAVLFITSTWICRSLIDTEEHAQAQITLVHANKTGLVYVTKLLSAYSFSVAVGFATVLLPMLSGVYGRPVTAAELGVSIVAHGVTGLIGTTLGCHFVDALTKSLSTSWGGLFIVWACSFSWKGLQSTVPSGIGKAVWLLPPVVPVADILLSWEESVVSIGGDAVGLLAWCAVYSTILAFGFIRRMMKRW